MNEIKPLPDLGPCRPGWYDYPAIPDSCRARVHPYMVENSESGEWYHKDSYEAVLSRLRRAVETLHTIAGDLDGVPVHENAPCEAMEALSAIGQVPEA